MEQAEPQVDWETALLVSERRFRLLADQAPVMIWRAGPDKQCDWFNRPWLEFTGRTLEQELGHGWAEGVHPDDHARCLEIYTTAFDARERFTMDYRLRRHDGAYRWIRDNGAPYFDDDGSFLGYFGSGIDVSDHVETELSLRRSLSQADQYDQQQKQAQWRQEMLIHELNHRVKNTLATIQSIAMQSFRAGVDVRAGLAKFEGRLVALSRAHDVLTQSNWLAAPLDEIVQSGIEPFRTPGDESFMIEGPPVRLPPKMALSLAMGIHELCTNALRFGALSARDGRVLIDWRLTGGEEADQLELTWQEAGGPPVHPPGQRGFGTRLIESGLAREFGGKVTLDFAPGGLVCRVQAPLPAEEPPLVGGLVVPHH
ncbi:MAG TPA: HWE histidine kinase domain-containing protein [Geminicoccus sp.]|uniref:sensor histidine kinase n=1 Tax=Geminicoccus sp. TaxID=2024832 RepID=UPI002C0CC5E9|nr:HWE histidine kinase domain-containing protein [Geminicoccus sp.]HWL68729.1 HWE histidine kinase domain-containing protein [Geminicoccus sp.]